MQNFITRAAFVAATIATASALPEITVKGSKLFAGGQQFYVKGFAYQGTGADPLLNGTQCALDFNLMKTLGANSIRVYHVDPVQDHTSCMKALEKAGMYLWVDLDTVESAITTNDPSWTVSQFEVFASVMDAFQYFTNVAGFFIGDEVITSNNNSNAAPYIKAAVTDLKAYRSVMGYRQIPIGYAGADIISLRSEVQNYLACGNTSTSIEFFGLNSYEWCGNENYYTSGYHTLQNITKDYNIPIFFSETGCIVPRPRDFSDQLAIFGPDMVNTWSGAMVYEWVNNVDGYGLVTYPNGTIYNGIPIRLEPEFKNLKNVWNQTHPQGVAEKDYTPTNSAPDCPLSVVGGWQVAGNPPLPTLGVEALFKAHIEDEMGMSGAKSTKDTSKGSLLRRREVPLAYPENPKQNPYGSQRSTNTTNAAGTSKSKDGFGAALFALWVIGCTALL